MFLQALIQGMQALVLVSVLLRRLLQAQLFFGVPFSECSPRAVHVTSGMLASGYLGEVAG